MSGGSLNYFYSYLEEHSDDLGDKELNHLVSDLAELYHDREWYLSGDYGKGQWIEARDAFKQKWFTEHGRQERVEQYLKEFCDEIRETFGLKTERCKTCKHWTQGKDDLPWGNCEFAIGYMVHRAESCERWAERRTDE